MPAIKHYNNLTWLKCPIVDIARILLGHQKIKKHWLRLVLRRVIPLDISAKRLRMWQRAVFMNLFDFASRLTSYQTGRIIPLVKDKNCDHMWRTPFDVNTRPSPKLFRASSLNASTNKQPNVLTFYLCSIINWF